MRLQYRGPVWICERTIIVTGNEGVMAVRASSRAIAKLAAAAGVLASVELAAQPLQTAPVNPDFVEYMESASMAGGAGGVGIVPAPVAIPPTGAEAGGAFDIPLPSARPPLRPGEQWADSGLGSWLFASLYSLEGCLMSFPLPGDPPEWNFSETNMKKQAKDRWGRSSGNAFMAAALLAGGVAPQNEGDPRFPPWNGEDPLPRAIPPLPVQVREILFLPGRQGPLDNKLITEKALRWWGPVYAEFFHDESYVTSDRLGYYYPYRRAPNRAVAIDGYRDDYPGSSFKPDQPGDGAFRCRTLWKSTDGNQYPNQYNRLWISYYDANLAANYSVLFRGHLANEDHTPFEQVYQYDELGWTTSVGLARNHLWAANIFQAGPSHEKLAGVGFYTTAAGTKYSLWIYTGASPDDPVTGGDLVYHAEGERWQAGYYGLEFDGEVEVKVNEPFSVVLKLETPGYRFPQAAETWIKGYTEGARSSPGQSYYSLNGSDWTDLWHWRPNANFCIKAYKPHATAPVRWPSELQLTPDNPRAGDGLAVEWVPVQSALDGAGDQAQAIKGSTVRWYRAEPASARLTLFREDTFSGADFDPRIDGSLVRKDQRWRAWARTEFYDGTADEDFSDTVRVKNTRPDPPGSLQINPPTPLSTEPLLVTWTASSDRDGDSLTYKVAPWINGVHQAAYDQVVSGERATIPARATRGGDVVRVWVRAYDGEAHSTPAATPDVTVGNTPPAPVSGLAPDSGSPTSAEPVRFTWRAGADLDGDDLTFDVECLINGAAVASYGKTGLTTCAVVIPADATAKGDTVQVRVTADDGQARSSSVDSPVVNIRNTPPSAPRSLKISPASPTVTDDLVATASRSTDHDGDAIVGYEYQWRKRIPGTEDWRAWRHSGATLDASTTETGDVWQARARASDGEDWGPWLEAPTPVAVDSDVPVLAWVGVPGYLGDGHDPQTGPADVQDFTWRVHITGVPGLARLDIERLTDARTWQLWSSTGVTLESGDPATGAVYRANSTLPNGTYRYRFWTNKPAPPPSSLAVYGIGPPTQWTYGPRVIGPPQLWCTGLQGRRTDFLHPQVGDASLTQFAWTVQYSDGDWDLPSVRRLDLQRKDSEGNWRGFGSEAMDIWAGRPYTGKFYSFKRKLPAGKYRYRFRFADDDGPATCSETVGPDATAWVFGPTVLPSVPPPGSSPGTIASLTARQTRAGVQVTFSLSSAGSVGLRVLNLAGRPVHRLYTNRSCEAGTNTLLWNAHDDTGLAVPGGVYLVEVTAATEGGSQTRALTQVSIRR